MTKNPSSHTVAKCIPVVFGNMQKKFELNLKFFREVMTDFLTVIFCITASRRVNTLHDLARKAMFTAFFQRYACRPINRHTHWSKSHDYRVKSTVIHRFTRVVSGELAAGMSSPSEITYFRWENASKSGIVEKIISDEKML